MERITRTVAHEEIAKIHKFESVLDSLREPLKHIRPEDLEAMRAAAYKGRETARINTAVILFAEEFL